MTSPLVLKLARIVDLDAADVAVLSGLGSAPRRCPAGQFATGKSRKILTIERPVSMHIDVSPDCRTILYTQIDDIGSDLMLVENFR